MNEEELMKLVDEIEMPEINSTLEITGSHVVLPQGGTRTMLGEIPDEKNEGSVMGRRGDDEKFFINIMRSIRGEDPDAEQYIRNIMRNTEDTEDRDR